MMIRIFDAPRTGDNYDPEDDPVDRIEVPK